MSTKHPPSKSRVVATTFDSLLAELHELLDEARGLHWTMAKECGVAQAIVSRTSLRLAVPRLDGAEKMLRWLRANRSRFDQMRVDAARRAAEARRRRVHVPAAAVPRRAAGAKVKASARAA